MTEETKTEETQEAQEAQLNEDGLVPGQDVDFDTMQRILKAPAKQVAEKPAPKKK